MTTMVDNIELPPLPEGYDKYDPPLLYDGQMFVEGQMRSYAREAVRLNTGRPPEGYALVSEGMLRAWGKLDEVRECCRYLSHATPQPAACRCVDCGGDQPEHDTHCAYMHSLHSGKTASVPVRVAWAEFWIAQGDWETAHDYAAFEKAERWLLAQQPPSATVGVDVRKAGEVSPYSDVVLVADLAPQPAAVDEAMVERIAALLHEEATDEPWTVAGVEHPGPDRDYYRGLARKVAALAVIPCRKPARGETMDEVWVGYRTKGAK